MLLDERSLGECFKVSYRTVIRFHFFYKHNMNCVYGNRNTFVLPLEFDHKEMCPVMFPYMNIHIPFEVKKKIFMSGR